MILVSQTWQLHTMICSTKNNKLYGSICRIKEIENMTKTLKLKCTNLILAHITFAFGTRKLCVTTHKTFFKWHMS